MARVVAAGLLLVSALALAGCAGAPTVPVPDEFSGSPVHAVASAFGPHLVDMRGRAVYQFGADLPGHSRCTGGCLQSWRVVPAPPVLPGHVDGAAATLGAITRPDGSRQLTVDGWPLYTYVGDPAPGTTRGQGVAASGGQWWLVDPTGHQIMALATSKPSPSAPNIYSRSY
jgi:predicted lipoprotein with Yx(FWY)xxD motif